MNWIKKLFEDASGIPDDARIAAFLIVLTYCGIAITSLVMGQAWKPLEFGGGAAALASGIGVWFGVRKAN